MVRKVKSGTKLIEMPSRWWCSAPFEHSESNPQRLISTIRGTRIFGRLCNNNSCIKWGNGAIFDRRGTYGLRVIATADAHSGLTVDEPPDSYEAFRIKTIDVPKPNSAARQTPRETAKHVNEIHQSMETNDVESILRTMQQNPTESTLYMGCLALGRLLTSPGECSTEWPDGCIPVTDRAGKNCDLSAKALS